MYLFICIRNNKISVVYVNGQAEHFLEIMQNEGCSFMVYDRQQGAMVDSCRETNEEVQGKEGRRVHRQHEGNIKCRPTQLEVIHNLSGYTEIFPLKPRPAEKESWR